MIKLPDDFIRKYQKLLGKDDANKLFTAIKSQPPKKGYRINSLKENKQVSYNTQSHIPVIPNAFYGEISGHDPEWISGTVYSQDPSAMFPSYIINAKPGERVLDLCAAPGGKSTAIAEQLQSRGLLVANEISPSRAKVLRENLERWGVTNALITNDKPENLTSQFPRFFDKILVDAPCSGEGMFRKDQQAIEYWSQDYVMKCQERQKKILTAAVKMLKPEGTLVYSTCTFSPEENEEIISWLSQKFELEILPIELGTNQVAKGQPNWADHNKELANTLRFWPTAAIGEGQFVAKLKLLAKPEMSMPGSRKENKKRKRRLANIAPNKAEIKLIAAILDQFNLPAALLNWRSDCLIRNNHVFIPAQDTTGLHVKILANGTELGLLKKNRFEPGHQLAMVLAAQKQTRIINLTANSYTSYLHGEAIKVNTDLKGFVLISYHNFILGFGKVVNQVLKNYYPKGLRF